MVIALILALAIGFALALLGSGGSIITLPVLVYAAGVPAQEAVAMSLTIVGGTTLFASLLNARAGLVHLKAAALFSGSGIIGALAGSQLTHLVSPSVLLLLFAALMIVVALLMFRRRTEPDVHPAQCHWPVCALSGLVVGTLTGFLGVGGGFLIVPALLHFGRLQIKSAIATSLVVITVVSFAGVIAHLQRTTFDWRVAGLFLVCALVGMFGGRAAVSRMQPERLRKWFAWFVLAVAVFVVAENWRTLF